MRGKVEAFSAASRRRLIEMMARLVTKGVRTVFLTLTFEGSPSPKEAKKSLKRFTAWMRRAHPQASAVWRMEPQQRGAPHFHLICFRLPWIDQKELQERWERCTKQARSIAHITLIRSKRGVMAYVSKYIAKRDRSQDSTSLDSPTYQHEGADESVGRHWGYVNHDGLPFAPLVSFLVEDEQLMRYAWWAISKFSRGRGAQNPSRALLYTDEASEFLAFLTRHAGLCGPLAREVLHGRARRKLELEY